MDFLSLFRLQDIQCHIVYADAKNSLFGKLPEQINGKVSCLGFFARVGYRCLEIPTCARQSLLFLKCCLHGSPRCDTRMTNPGDARRKFGFLTYLKLLVKAPGRSFCKLGYCNGNT